MASYAVRQGAAFAVLGAWVLAAVFVQLRRERGRSAADWTLPVLLLAQIVAISVALRLARNGYGALGGGLLPVVAGLVVAASGLGLRIWAILTLGRFFNVTVVIQDDHRVVSSGPYRLLRHPSYTGLLLILLGLGLAVGTWPAIAVATLVPLPAFMARIVVEERALNSALGDSYRDYSERTHRLIPGIW